MQYTINEQNEVYFPSYAVCAVYVLVTHIYWKFDIFVFLDFPHIAMDSDSVDLSYHPST